MQFELTRYLSDNWVPVIEKDVDGPNSLPLRLDGEVPNLGKFAACRRVARTIYLGSAPTATAAHRGLEDRRVKLGCVMPGESPAVFGDALRRLAAAATYLYQDGPRYWYSTQPTVTKLAEDRAEQLKRDPDKVAHELDERLRADLRKHGRLQPHPPAAAVRRRTCPTTSTRGWSCSASTIPTARSRAAPPRPRPRRSSSRAATRRASTATRWSSSRPTRPACRTSTRRCASYLAWESILAEKDTLNLDPHQVKQAETQKHGRRRRGDGAAARDLPVAAGARAGDAGRPRHLAALRLSGQDALAVRASKKLRNDELLVTGFAATRLRMELDRIPLWRGDHVAVKQLRGLRPVPLPAAAQGPRRPAAGHRDGVGLLTWEQDSFAYAESYDEAAGRYRGLRGGQHIVVREDDKGLLVKPDVAKRQMDAEAAAAAEAAANAARSPSLPPITGSAAVTMDPMAVVSHRHRHRRRQATRTESAQGRPQALPRLRRPRPAARRPRRQPHRRRSPHPPGRPGRRQRARDAGDRGRYSGGAPDNVVRIVTENGRTLKFQDSGFESE